MAESGHLTKAMRHLIRSILPMRSRPAQSILTSMDISAEITIRPEHPDDELTLHRLAALDSSEGLPSRPLLLAEVDGELRVALSLTDGTAIADPFFPTAAIIALLRGHARRHDLRAARNRPDTLSAWRRGRHGVAAGTRLA